MKELAKNLAKKICLVNDITDSEKREIIAYGLEILLSTAVSVLIITILAILLGTFWETILFLLSFMLLRTYSGGYHAQTHFRCFLILFFAFSINFMLNIFNINTTIIVFSALASVFIILRYAPVEDKNHPLSKKQKKNNRKICLIMLSILLVVCIILFLNQNNKALFNMVYGITITALSIIAVKIKSKTGGVKNEKV